MNGRTLAAVLLTALSAPAQEALKPEARGPHYTMATAGDSVILLDTITGESWVLQKPKGPGKPAWVPIERKAAGPRAPAAREVPLVQEIDVSGLQPVHGPRGGPKGEQPRRARLGPYTPSPDYVSLRNLGEHFHDPNAAAVIARQIDPDRQQLLLMKWHPQTTGDRLTASVKDGKVEFLYEQGRPHERSCGEDAYPSPHTRLFAVRAGIKWSLGHRHDPTQGQGHKGEPKR